MIREFHGRVIDFKKVSYVSMVSLKYQPEGMRPEAFFNALIDGDYIPFVFHAAQFPHPTQKIWCGPEAHKEIVERYRDDFIGLMKIAHKTPDLAAYVAGYIEEEVERGNEINQQIIQQAFDAFEGGAR